MTTLTTPLRAAATLLALAFAGGTGYVLLEDVIRHGAAITTAHVLTGLALVGTIAAGHFLWIEARAGHLVSALGCALLFCAGTGYIVTASGARNAEAMAGKAAAVRTNNHARGDVEKRIREHEYALAACPAGAPKEHHGVRCGLRPAMVAECGSGKGTQCTGKTYSVELYESALRGLRADLARMVPEAKEHAGYAHAAKVLAALPGVTASPEALAERLVLLMPFVLVLIAEIGTLLFAHMALRGASGRLRGAESDAPTKNAPSKNDRAQTSFADSAPASLFAGEQPDPPPGPRPGARRRLTNAPRVAGSLLARSDSRSASRPDRAVVVPFVRPASSQRDAVLAAIRAELAAGRAFPSQRALSAAYGVPRSTMSDWLGAWEAAGQVPPRRITGRTKRLASL